MKERHRLTFKRVLCLSGFAGTGTRKGCVIIMENRTNRRLLLLFAATLFFYLVLAICGSMPSWMMLGFPIIPAFCLQLLLCRVLRRKWLAVLPLVVIGGALLVFVWGLTRQQAASPPGSAMPSIPATGGSGAHPLPMARMNGQTLQKSPACNIRKGGSVQREPPCLSGLADDGVWPAGSGDFGLSSL